MDNLHFKLRWFSHRPTTVRNLLKKEKSTLGFSLFTSFYIGKDQINFWRGRFSCPLQSTNILNAASIIILCLLETCSIIALHVSFTVSKPLHFTGFYRIYCGDMIKIDMSSTSISKLSSRLRPVLIFFIWPISMSSVSV